MSPTVLDFGAVRLHAVSEKTITVINDEREPLMIAQVAMQGGDGAFSHSFGAPITVAPSSSAEVSVRFKPTSAGAYDATMTFIVQGAGSKELPVALKGIGLNKDCFLAPETGLDFGMVSVTASLVSEVRIRNESDLPWDVEVGRITGQEDSETFALLNFELGRHTVPARGELAVPIRFMPMRLGMHEAVLSIFESPTCPKTVRLTGVGVDDVLECESRELVDRQWVCRVNFGAVLPTSQVTAEIGLRNLGNVDLKVTLPESALVQPPGKGAPFAVETAEREFTVPAGGGRVVVPVSFSPNERGAQQGSLTFDAPGSGAGSLRVELYGEGGGPEMQVTPDPMNFGEVAVDTWQWRKLTITNVGIDVEGTDDDNLRLERTSSDGTVFEPAVVLVSDTPDEFALEPLKAYPAAGIPAIAGKNSVELRVKFSPKTLGDKRAVLRIYSNDPARPIVEVQVQGVGANGTCEYQIAPKSIVIGLVEPPKFGQQSVYVINTSPYPKDTCIVSSLDLAPATSDAWVLVEGPVTEYSIPGGETLEVPLRFQPKTANSSYSGAIEFTVSNAAQPHGRIELSGGTAKSCLVMTPSEIDFGVVGSGCGFGKRTVSVFNICATDVAIEELVVEAGSSAAFTLSQKPAMPAKIAPGAELKFKVSYRPTSVGQDSGLVSLKSAQQSIPYVLSLAGRGAPQGIQTDVFVQDSWPKTDVLLVVDDSSSMSGLQANLAKNFASFVRYANNNKYDYHLAVTTTGVNKAHGNTVTDGLAHNGIFAPLDLSRPTVLTRKMLDLDQVFAQNVAVGTGGNSRPMLIRPAYLALSSPQVLRPSNAGFLRDEANLAIIVVSNSDDQDSIPVGFYRDFFESLKANRPNSVSFSAIIPTLDDPPAGCGYGNPNAGRSTRVKSLVTATGGILSEICSPSWAASLEGIGHMPVDRTRFSLSVQPDLTLSLVVKVDGRDVPPKGGNGMVQWTYDATDNAIDFDYLVAPPPESTVEVSYHVNCLP